MARSRLAELGCIDQTKLAAVINGDEKKIEEQMAAVINVLSLELWIQRRAEARHVELGTIPATALPTCRAFHSPFDEEVA
jgi:hypothetical protein